MAGHYKKPGYKPTTSIAIDEALLTKIDKFKFRNEIDNRSQAIEKLIMLGFMHLQQKKRERMLG